MKINERQSHRQDEQESEEAELACPPGDGHAAPRRLDGNAAGLKSGELDVFP